MKKTLALFATVLAAVLNAATPSTSLVYKETANSAITGDLTFPSGKTLTLNGTLAGTPAGGTLNLSAVTLTPPSNIVTLTGTQTLTNKTLTSPTLTTPSIGAATGTSLSLTGAATSNNAFLVDTNTSFVSHTATAGKLQAQTSWGGVLSGFGTTNDVSIFNKSGGLALSVPTGTTNVGIAGTLLIPDGTTAAPSLTFAADTNTGIARAATDSLEITAGGTRSALFTSTGQTVSGNLTVSGTGTSTFGGTVRAGAGSGETLSAGSVDVTGDIGIKSTQGIVQGNARIVTFTSGNTSLAGNLTVSGSGGTTTSDVTLGTSGPSVKSSLGARAPRQGLVFDGTSVTTSWAGNVLGTNDFTASAWVYIREQPAASQIKDIFSSTGGSAFALRMNTYGGFFFDVAATYSGGTNLIDATPYIGKWAHVVYSRSYSGTTTFYVNGVAAATRSPNDTTNYSGTTNAIGTNGFPGTIAGPLLYNRALSAAEVLALYESGAPAASDYTVPSATNTAVQTGFSADGSSVSNFTSTANSWSGDYKAGVGAGVAITYTGNGGLMKKGQRYRLSYSSTGGSGLSMFLVDGAGFSQSLPLGSSQSVEFTYTGTGGFRTAFFANGSNATVSFTNIAFVPVGLLLAPDAQQVGGGSVWADTSGNKAHITLPASGVSWNVPSQIGEYISSTVAYASRIALTTAVPGNVTSLSLTAGDWDVSGVAVIQLNSATCTAMTASVTTAGGTVGSLGEYTQTNPNTTTASFQYFQNAPTVRVSVTSTTTVYLVGSATFSAGTADAFGFLRARRVR